MNVMVAAHVIFVAEPGIIASWPGELAETRNKDCQTNPSPARSSLCFMRLWQSLFCILRISARHETTSGDTGGAGGHRYCGSLTRQCHVCNLVQGAADQENQFPKYQDYFRSG